MQKDMEVMIDQLRKANTLAPGFKHREVNAAVTKVAEKSKQRVTNILINYACQQMQSRHSCMHA